MTDHKQRTSRLFENSTCVESCGLQTASNLKTLLKQTELQALFLAELEGPVDYIIRNLAQRVSLIVKISKGINSFSM